MNRERTFRSMIAACIMRWPVLLIGFVLGAVVLLQIASKMTQPIDMKVELCDSQLEIIEENEKTISDNELKITKMEKEIEDCEWTIEKVSWYFQSSLLMRIDPYEESVTTVDLVICLPEEKTMSGEESEYRTAQIANQYLVCFKNINVGDNEELSELNPDALEKYWKEVISVDVINGSIIEIRAVAKTVERSEDIAHALVDIITGFSEQICLTSYDHTLSELSNTTRQIYDEELEDYIARKKGEINGAEELISIDEVKIETLKKENIKLTNAIEAIYQAAENSGSVSFFYGLGKTSIALMGGILGGVLSSFVIMLWCVWTSRVVTSFEVENILHIAFMGNVSGRNRKWDKRKKTFANQMAGERIWKSDEDACQFIGESVKSTAKGSSVLLVAPQAGTITNEMFLMLEKSLESMDLKVTVVEDAEHDSSFLRALKKCDCMVIMGKPMKTTFDQIQALKNVCDRVNGCQVGFILDC